MQSSSLCILRLSCAVVLIGAKLSSSQQPDPFRTSATHTLLIPSSPHIHTVRGGNALILREVWRNGNAVGKNMQKNCGIFYLPKFGSKINALLQYLFHQIVAAMVMSANLALVWS